MNVHEWPLVVFTILSQMAVGAFVVLGVLQTFGRHKYDTKVVDRVTYPVLYVIGVIMVFALAASMFHLGDPFHAPNAIRHVATSWLAREILFGAGFAGLGFAFAIMQWFQLFTPLFRQIWATFTAVWGLVFLWVMSSVYLLPTVPAWNVWTTPAQFYITAGLLGTLAIGVALAVYPRFSKNAFLNRWTTGKDPNMLSADDLQVKKLVSTALKWIGLAAVMLLIASLVVSGFVLGQPEGVNPPAHPFSMTAFVVRIVLLIVGAGLLGFYLTIQGRDAAQGTVSAKISDKLLALTTSSLTLVLVAEFIGRFIFYGLMNRVGI